MQAAAELNPHSQASHVPFEEKRSNITEERTEVQKSDESKSQDAAKRRRAKILIEATRDFCRNDVPSSELATKYKEFFYQFVDDLSVADKRIVAAMLARMPFTPRSIALFLSMEELEISAPFLLFSPVLGSSDLRAIGFKMGVDYKRVISRRRGDDLATIEFEEEKKGSTLPQIEKKENTTKILPAIQSETQKEKLLSSDEIMALASVGGRLGRSKTNSASASKKEISIKKPATNDELYQLARDVDKAGFIQNTSERCNLFSNVVESLIKNEKGDEIVYLIKALGFQAPKDMQLLLMLSPRYGRNLANYKSAQKLFSELEIGICQMIFNELGANFKVPGTPAPTKIQGNRSDEGFARAVNRRLSDVSGNRYMIDPIDRKKNNFGRKAS